MKISRAFVYAFLLVLLFNFGLLAEPPKKPQELTIGAFPRNLCVNFVGLFASENVTPLHIGIFATGAVYPFDRDVRDFFRDHQSLRNEAKVASFLGGYYMIGGTVGALFVAGNISNNERFHSMTYALAQGYVINNAWTNAFKFSIRRLRPDESNRRSFLSGHASNAFMVAAVLDHYYGWKAAIPSYTVAALVAASRVQKRRHFMSDVVAGATLGYVIGKTVAANTTGSHRKQSFQLIPTISPSGKAAGATLFLRF